MTKVTLIILYVCVSCSSLHKPVDEICYDKCLEQNMYVKIDEPNKCECARLNE